MNSSDRMASTLYCLGTWLVSGIYVQIPCIREIVMIMMMIITIIIITPSQITAGGKTTHHEIHKVINSI
jgi:hypothetical protein